MKRILFLLSLSFPALASLPRTPGTIRAAASAMQSAANSPPVTTKSPMETSRSNIPATRSSTPSYRPQTSITCSAFDSLSASA